jgi:hypothetical protein
MPASLRPLVAALRLDIPAPGKWEMNASYLVAMSLGLILCTSRRHQAGRMTLSCKTAVISRICRYFSSIFGRLQQISRQS